ncbi:MAG: CBS domain-containing protein [Desulfobacterales bacterium]|jgi:signal-transduction protein with cAMP-binding, CBS, and nucleotidyltransferase domain
MIDAESIITEKGRDLVTVPANATIHEALLIMINANVGSILVEKDGNIVGIWTERDLLRDTVKAGFDPVSSRISDYMVSPLITAPHTDTVFNLMDKFLGLRISHLLIEKGGETIGLLSVGDVMKATLSEKTNELNRLNAMVSWDYYENWRWKPAK